MVHLAGPDSTPFSARRYQHHGLCSSRIAYMKLDQFKERLSSWLGHYNNFSNPSHLSLLSFTSTYLPHVHILKRLQPLQFHFSAFATSVEDMYKSWAPFLAMAYPSSYLHSIRSRRQDATHSPQHNRLGCCFRPSSSPPKTRGIFTHITTQHICNIEILLDEYHVVTDALKC